MGSPLHSSVGSPAGQNLSLPPADHNPSVGQNIPVNTSQSSLSSLPVGLNPAASQHLQVAENPSLNHQVTHPALSRQATALGTAIPPNIKCVEITPHKQSVRELSASQINKAELIDPDIVIRKYPSYHCINRVPTLAQRLASQSYFGDDVLSKCTVMGCRDSPALPLRELNQLKQKLFLLFPHFWANPLDFEETWSRCTISIGQRCKRIARMATATR